MNKPWYLTCISIFFLICVLILIQNSNRYSVKSFYGIWNAEFKNHKIKLELNSNNKCSISIIFLLSNKVEKINGYCSIDFSKKPNTFVMNNIKELNFPLYSIVFLENDSTLSMSNFSSKWRIRPVEFKINKKIVFKKEV